MIDSGDFHGRLFLVMELVEGQNLRQAHESSLRLTTRLDLAIQVTRALGAIHDRGSSTVT